MTDRSIYYARMAKLHINRELDARAYSSFMLRVYTSNANLCDRSGHVKMPFKFGINPGFELPEYDPNATMTYEDCCQRRAQEFVDMSKRLNVPINVLYSGGIDSTLILVSFLKLLSKEELRERVVVALNLDSINENARFYYNYIRPNFRITSSENIGTMLDGSCIMLGGEFNDQLFGSDAVGIVFRATDTSDELHKPFSRKFITDFFIFRGVKPLYAHAWYTVIEDQIKAKAKCEVTTNFHFLWWVNFVYKWQPVYFRILATLHPTVRATLTEDFVKTYYHHFFNPEYFQQWSMNNHQLKLQTDWSTYKGEAKRLIFEYNKDKEYLNKAKIGSLYRLFVQMPAADAITSKFEFLTYDKLDSFEFYQPDNSFSQLVKAPQ